MYPGAIFRDAEFYVDQHGALQAKFLVILAAPATDDVVVRLLTSRVHGRPINPPCFHGAPYAGYFLGVPGGALTQPTWLDLRYMDDVDRAAFDKRKAQGVITPAGAVPSAQLRAMLECAANADDTTRRQERLLRDVIATLPAPT